MTGLNAEGYPPRGVDDVGREELKRNIAQDTRDYVANTTGWFNKRDMERELQLTTKNTRDAGMQSILRMIGTNDLISHHSEHGRYRKRHAEMEKIP